VDACGRAGDVGREHQVEIEDARARFDRRNEAG